MTENYLWIAYGLDPLPEFRFAPPRKWRFDWAWPERLVAVEIEGGVWIRGRHTRGSGFVKDMEKYNEAGFRGWRVFKFTPDQLKQGLAQAFMLKLFKKGAL